MNRPITTNRTRILRRFPHNARHCLQASSGPPASGRRAAFTLIELMLSLVLVSFVLTIVAMAIDIHLRVLGSGRAKVEEGQLARAILQRIADDLRNTVVYRPPDATGQITGMLNRDLSDQERELVEEFVSFESSDTSSSTDPGTVSSIPGLYGASNWLQIDVMRLPRIDEYNSNQTEMELSTTGDVLSAVKTVLYFLEVPEETGALAADGSSRYDGGLMRRELDRSATLWADQQAALGQMNLELEPLAVEVSDICFEYHDGTEFLDSWDTQEKSGLPKAVRISIAITPVDDQGGEFATIWSSVASDLEAEGETVVYRLLVTLPISDSFEEAMQETLSGEMSLEEISSDEMSSDETPSGEVPSGGRPSGEVPSQ